MPLFAYRCTACDHDFEELVLRAEEAVACPSCSSTDSERQLSLTSAPPSTSRSLPITGGCPPSDAPPCNPHCCRLP